MIGLGSTVGNYRVVKKLGSGAMGAVYLAEHPTIGKKVALKVIHADLAENEEMLSRFFNEARAVTQIGHQNIIEVIDFGQSPDGDNFIVMELLEGRSLGDVLKETPILDLPRVIHIAVQIADGLYASHQRGIVHRDLKPDNIYLIPRFGDLDFVKILDFGLAKLTQGGGALSHKTRAGSVLGTPHYMAPEQCEGKPDIDHRVDVYAIGCILYQMLCGRVPFPGEGFGEVLVKHLREPPVMPTKLNPAIPRPIEAIILNALAKRKEFRFQSMKEVSRALRDPDRYMRELDGETSLSPSTTEMPAPVLRIARPVAPVPVGPVVKGDEQMPTMLDELPDAVKDAVAGQVRTVLAASTPPPPSARAVAAAAAAVNSGASTMLFDVAAGSLSPDTTHPAVPSPLGYPTEMRPVTRASPARTIALAAGVAVLLVGGVVVATRLGKPPVAVGNGVAADRDPAGAAAIKAPIGPRVITVQSDPEGAEVFRGDEALGVAPVSIRIEPKGAPVPIRVHHEGYTDVHRTLDTGDDTNVTVKLVAKAPPALPVVPLANDTATDKPAAAEKGAATLRSAGTKTKKPKKRSGHSDDILIPNF